MRPLRGFGLAGAGLPARTLPTDEWESLGAMMSPVSASAVGAPKAASPRTSDPTANANRARAPQLISISSRSTMCEHITRF